MKQENILEVKPFYKADRQTLDRENSLILDVSELIPEKRKKPDRRTLQELRYIKNLRKENKFYEPKLYPEKTIEYSIGTLANKKLRKQNRQEQINQIVSLLSDMQKQRGYLSLSEEFINDILLKETNLKTMARLRLLKLILNKAVKKTDRVVSRKYLVGECHNERRLKNERTKSKKHPIEIVWEVRNKLLETYSFIQQKDN